MGIVKENECTTIGENCSKAVRHKYLILLNRCSQLKQKIEKTNNFRQTNL